MLMEIKVLFFGVRAEVTKTGFRHYSNVRSFEDLILKIEDEFPETVHYNYRIAVNKELIDDDPIVRDGDEVAFLPPFAGG
jgi:molybdopterin synthase sulfur carrier subunit